MFKGYYQNVRGLRTKLTELRCNIPLLKFDFFTLAETWLNGSLYSTESGFNNYNIFKTDRSLNTSSN